jgi:ATP-dependent Clp protease ATP-binding subunit ClpA
MLSAGDVDYLIEATRSSVKRFGGDGPTLSHLAYVLSDKWPDQFAQVFGKDGAEDVKRLLQRKSFVGNEADIRSILTNQASESSVLADLHTRLADAIEAAEPPTATATAAHEEPAPPAHPVTQPAPAADAGEWPERTRRFLVAVEPRDDLLERVDAINLVVAVLRRDRWRVPIIMGRRGSGRTTMLGGVAAALKGRAATAALRIWRVAPETMGADAAGPLQRIIEDCEAPTVLMVDDVDQLARLGTAEPNGDFLMLLRAAVIHPRLRVVLVCDSRRYKRLEVYVEDLVEQLAPVTLDSLTDDAVRTVIERVVPEIESNHGVKISHGLRSLACLPARPTDVAVHPGLAIDRLDAAASHASVLGNTEADVADLAGVAAPSSHAMRAGDLELQLSQRVRGQPLAVRSVAARLALTLARLDLRPERPNGVFLFVGPTGVGKTELARAMSACLFGVDDRLIRLDMSEYAHDWAVSRLVGPMPGYVGSTEPENWLTTRVKRMPECVVLLDEIEKSHPMVWNTFLQVFDAGRLTDSRGSTADFSGAVIVMTSNIGTAASMAPPLGFGSAEASANLARERITRAVKETMAPELVNRIDELVVFDSLSVEAIAEIAERELAAACHLLAESGWSVSYDQDVVKHLVTAGYDPAYGARHLQRNIERMFLALIAESETKRVSVRVDGGELKLRHE